MSEDATRGAIKPTLIWIAARTTTFITVFFSLLSMAAMSSATTADVGSPLAYLRAGMKMANATAFDTAKSVRAAVTSPPREQVLAFAQLSDRKPIWTCAPAPCRSRGVDATPFHAGAAAMRPARSVP